MQNLDQLDPATSNETDSTPTVSMVLNEGLDTLSLTSDDLDTVEKDGSTVVSRFHESIVNICEDINETIKLRAKEDPTSPYAKMVEFKPGHALSGLSVLCCTGADYFQNAIADAMLGAMCKKLGITPEMLQPQAPTPTTGENEAGA